MTATRLRPDLDDPPTDLHQPVESWIVRHDHTGLTPFDPARSQPDSRPRRGAQAAAWLALGALVALVVVLQLGAWLALLALFLGWAVSWAAGWRGRSMRVMVMAMAVFATSVDYVVWRASVISWPAFYVGVPLFLAELHALVHNVGLQVGLLPRARVPFSDDLDPATRPVFVFVPTVDEGVEIVGDTLRGIRQAADAYRAEHPAARFRIVVCNDGGVAGAECSGAVEDLCADMGVTCVTRAVGGGAKAGNVENARQLVGATGDCFIVIFDADQIPERGFFIRTLAPLCDASVGWVQSGQFYRNRGNIVARWADDQQSLFYRLLCPAKSAMDAAFICGTNVVLRGEALDEIGGFPTDSVTEDFAASILLAPRWRSVYVPGVLATGLGPVTLTAYLKQQERWARGTLTVLRSRWREVFVPRRGGMPLAQRVQYALALTHYLCGLRDLVFLVTPMLFLLLGVNGVRGATLHQFMAHFLPYYVVAGLAFVYAANRTTTWRSVVIGFASMPVLLQASAMVFVGREGHFTLTPKRRTHDRMISTMAPFLVIGATALLAIGVGLLRGGVLQWVAIAWLLYFEVLVGLILHLIWRDAHTAELPEARVGRSRALPTPTRRTVLGVAAAVAVGGLAAAIWPRRAVTAQGAGPLTSSRQPLRVGFTQTGSVPTALSQPCKLAGRTFEMGDAVDAGWLTTQSNAGRVPWINLVFTTSGKITLESTLTAIANGVDDTPVHRWAADLAAYGRPVYLTVLGLDDRNYATSSAVARGDVPADSARAWAHLRGVFQQAGATNVAWVWNPADAAHDTAFAPPASQLDAVGVTMFAYPRTAWADPATLLRRASAAHPGKPLLVTVATSGTSTSGVTRSQYLTRLAGAVAARDDVGAVLYNLSGPESDTTSAAARAWSLAGDTAAQRVVLAMAGAR